MPQFNIIKRNTHPDGSQSWKLLMSLMEEDIARSTLDTIKVCETESVKYELEEVRSA